MFCKGHGPATRSPRSVQVFVAMLAVSPGSQWFKHMEKNQEILIAWNQPDEKRGSTRLQSKPPTKTDG